jgi:hypothetical protein
VVDFIIMAMKGYNASGGVACFMVPNDPPHCIGYENGDTPEGFSIPCGRGDGGENPILYLVMEIVGFGSVLIIPPTIIVGTMMLMYMSVSKIEKNMRNYGVGALRLNARSGGGNRGDTAETNSARSANNEQGMMSKIKRLFMFMIPSCLRRDDQRHPTSRANRATSQKRSILYMAAGYALAWAFVWIPFMILYYFHESHATSILLACLNPLQGLFNFLVYMSPKVRSAKQPRRGDNLSWRQAFIKAYMSRGERRRTGRNLSSGNTRTTGSRVSVLKHRVQRFLNSLLSRTRSTRDTRSNQSNACTTNDQSSPNLKQVSAPAEILTSTNPHLADDMKNAKGIITTRPQQQDLLATDGDDEEKCEEQKASYHLG